jgi:hypothetical protein
MQSDDKYIKASRYNLEAQPHNRLVFHRQLLARPWQALTCAVGMTVLGAIPAFNLVEGPRWNQHPWQGWILGGIAFLIAGYFLVCAVLGWQRSHASVPETKA